MRLILHILTRPADSMVTDIMARQQNEPGVTVEVVDLTRSNPDYEALLQRIFAADSVQVW